jgi:hypothetical protein
MILAAYIDESGTHGSPLMVMGGYVGRSAQWEQFDQNWSCLLQQYGVSHLHSHHLLHRNGEFKGWSVVKAIKFAEAAEDICQRHTMFGFAVVMKIDDFRANYAEGTKPRKSQLDTKYGVCFRACLSYLPTAIRREIKLDEFDLNIVLEAGHPNTGDATRLFGLFKRQADPKIARLVKTLTVADKKEFAGLQAADIVAYEAFRKEQGVVEVLEFPPGEGSLEEAREFARTKSPVFRLPVTPAILRDLKNNILSQREAPRQFGRTMPIASRAQIDRRRDSGLINRD